MIELQQRKEGVSGSPPALGAGYLVGSNPTFPTKYCSRCDSIKSVSEFHRRGNGLQSICKSCRKLNDADWWKKNAARMRKLKAQRKQEKRDWYRQLKNKPCVDCKKVYPPAAMHWDHRDNENKSANVS